MVNEQAVILLTSRAADKNRNFGSGFVVARKGQVSYVLTCAHVVEQIGREQLCAAGTDAPVSVLHCGSGDGIDIAVLQVEGLQDKPLLNQFAQGQEQAEVQVAGYSLFDARTGQHIKRTLNGQFGKRNSIGAQGWPLWDVAITDDSFSTLEGGYSGSPVCNAQGQVVAITSHRRSGQHGHAFCISNLASLCPDFAREHIHLAASRPNIAQLRTELLKRSREIAKVFLKLREKLNALEQGQVDEEGQFVLEMCQAFLAREIDAETFIASCFPDNPTATQQQGPNYQLLARRLQDGEIVTCLGDIAPAPEINRELPQRIASVTAFQPTASTTLAAVCEYAELHPDYQRHTIKAELKKLLTPPQTPSIALYDLLTKLDKPLLAIYTGFDTWLEQQLRACRKPVAAISVSNADSERERYLLRYSDKPGQHACSDDELSTLQLLEKGYWIVFYPRGCQDDESDNLLLSERDYFNAIENLRKRYPAYVQNKLKNKGLWFIGYQPASWETRLLAKSLLQLRGSSNRDLPLVVDPQADEFAKLFWQDMKTLHYPHLDVADFVAQLGEKL